MRKIFFSYVLLLVALDAQAGAVDFSIHGSSAEAQFARSGRFATGLVSGFTGYGNDDGVSYFSIDLQSQLEAVQNSGALFGLGVSSFLLNQPLETGEAADDTNLGVAVALQAGYRLIINNVPAQVVLNLEHSPNIINGAGLNALTRANLRSEFSITSSVVTYLGYRDDRAVHNHENLRVAETYDSGLMVGFRFRINN